MVVVSHLSLFLGDKFRSRCDSCESHLLLFKTIYFPIAPLDCLYLPASNSVGAINLYLYIPDYSRFFKSFLNFFEQGNCSVFRLKRRTPSNPVRPRHPGQLWPMLRCPRKSPEFPSYLYSGIFDRAALIRNDHNITVELQDRRWNFRSYRTKECLRHNISLGLSIDNEQDLLCLHDRSDSHRNMPDAAHRPAEAKNLLFASIVLSVRFTQCVAFANMLSGSLNPICPLCPSPRS